MNMSKNTEILKEIVEKVFKGEITKEQWRNMLMAQLGATLVGVVLVPKPLLVALGGVAILYAAFDPIYDAIKNGDYSDVPEQALHRLANVLLYPAITAYVYTK